MSSLRILRHRLASATGPRPSLQRTIGLRASAQQTTLRSYSISFNRPAPPPLPPKEQQEYEELIRAASTPDVPNFTDANVSRSSATASASTLHPDARTPPKPEFEGDVNPVTGERGGPKQEPLRHGDWSFGGRATDF